MSMFETSTADTFTETPAPPPVVLDFTAAFFDPPTRMAAIGRIYRAANDGRFGTLSLVSSPDGAGRRHVTHLRFPDGAEMTLEEAMGSGLFP